MGLSLHLVSVSDNRDNCLRSLIRLQSLKFKPDNITLACEIKACAGFLDVGLEKVIHGMATKLGLISGVFVGNALNLITAMALVI